MARKKPVKDERVAAVITKKLFWFGQQMSAYRKLKGWDQAELGLKLGLGGEKSRAAISRLENGKRGISFSSMVHIANILGYDLGLTFTAINKTEAAVMPAARVATGKAEEKKIEAPSLPHPPVEVKKNLPYPPPVKKDDFSDIPSND